MTGGSLEVLAVIVARDEEEAIVSTVTSLLAIPRVDDVVVVDDGSTDATASRASRAGARVIQAPRNLGKGTALERVLGGLPRPHVFLLVDADVGTTASETADLLEPVLSGTLDLAIARFPRPSGGGFGLVKALAASLVRLASAFEPREPLSGQRALSADVLFACRPLAHGFGLETAMTIDAVRLGFRVGEVPVRMSHRPTGRGLRGFAHRGRQGLHVLRAALPRLAGLR